MSFSCNAIVFFYQFNMDIAFIGDFVRFFAEKLDHPNLCGYQIILCHYGSERFVGNPLSYCLACISC